MIIANNTNWQSKVYFLDEPYQQIEEGLQIPDYIRKKLEESREYRIVLKTLGKSGKVMVVEMDVNPEIAGEFNNVYTDVLVDAIDEMNM